MLNYPEIVKQLEEKDEYAMTKLAIYHELSSLTYIEELSAEDIIEIIEYLHNIYMNNDDMSYRYPKVAEASLYICNYDLNVLLTSIKENQEELENQILDKLDSI